jgi:hypothetical protein
MYKYIENKLLIILNIRTYNNNIRTYNNKNIRTYFLMKKVNTS